MRPSRRITLSAGATVLMAGAMHPAAAPVVAVVTPCSAHPFAPPAPLRTSSSPSHLSAVQVPPAPRVPGEYYAIDLVPTGRVPGTAGAEGKAMSAFARSPFGIAVAPGGAYRHDLDIRVNGLRPRRDGVYVAWTASSDLQEVARLGVLDESGGLRATVAWNKFLVIVSLERSADGLPDRWQGPIVMRGMSRSGLMHTMAGHGAYEGEPCVKYGYR